MTTTEILLLSIFILSLVSVLLLLKQNQPTAPASRGSKSSVLLDTCALIDGRIIELAKAGFIEARLLVPRSVIRELQYLADGHDPQKRERARFGLDVVSELQQLKNINLELIGPKDSPEAVDEQLISLARQHGAQLYTTDFNLNKVAQVEGVNVLNVNEMAHALRPHYLPGEKATVKLVQPGQDSHQAVGYLEDGTMVVVEKARKYMGQKVNVTFTRMLQTQAGKMTFASLDKVVARRKN